MTVVRPRSDLAAWVAAGFLLSLSGCGAEAPPADGAATPTTAASPKPSSAPSAPAITFTDITRAAGIQFVHFNGARGEKLLPETMGSGVAVLDYDGDGDMDLFFVNSSDWPGQEPIENAPKPIQALYRNDGKGNFENVTKGSGLDVTLPGQGVAVGDYDNDGDPDIYITTVSGGRLFRNDGGKFNDVTEEANAKATDGWLASVAFIDVENDGDLDLFVTNYLTWSPEIDRGINLRLMGDSTAIAYDPPTALAGTLNILLRNDGGKFNDITEEAGIAVRSPDQKLPMAKALGVAPYDVDGDGLTDVAVANDTVPNFLFHNKGNGKFEEIGMTAGIAFDQAGQARGAMGIDWADFLNDGSLGLAIGNFSNEMMALYVTESPESLQFADLANLYGLGAPTQPPMKFGLFFFDYDLDGRPDLLSTNGHLESDIEKVLQAGQKYAQPAQLFWNSGEVGHSLFVQVGPESAGSDLFDPIVGRGSAYADFDGDGDLDVVFTANGGPAKLLRNENPNPERSLRLRLKGTASNRDGIGARLEVTDEKGTQRAQLYTAKSYYSAVEPILTFGRGANPSPVNVTIHWPSGRKSTHPDLAPGIVHTLEEPGS